MPAPDHTSVDAAASVRDFYDNAPCGFHSIDAGWTFVEINQTELTWLGRTRDEVIGKLRFADIVPPEGQDHARRLFERFRRDGRLRNERLEIVARDGTRRPVLLNSVAITDANGGLVASRSTLVDLTGQAEAERALAASGAFLADILDVIPVMVFVKDADLRFEIINRAAREFLGIGPDVDVTGSTVADLVPEEQARQFNVYDQQVLATAQAVAVTVDEISTPEGPRWVANRRVPLIDDAGRVRSVVGVASDVTEQVEARRAITAAQDAAAAANAIQLRFLSRVSHEMRTPLHHILGFAQVLQRSGLDPEQREDLEQIFAGGTAMLEIVDKLLALSREVTQAPADPLSTHDLLGPADAAPTEGA